MDRDESSTETSRGELREVCRVESINSDSCEGARDERRRTHGSDGGSDANAESEDNTTDDDLLERVTGGDEDGTEDKKDISDLSSDKVSLWRAS